jgi:hypothetical protein
MPKKFASLPVNPAYPSRRRQPAIVTGFALGGEQVAKQADKQPGVCQRALLRALALGSS